MPIVFACIAPHGGHLLLPPGVPTSVPRSRAAMAQLEQELRDARPDVVTVLTPHGLTVDDAYSIGICARAAGEIDGVKIELATDLDLAATWAYRAAERGVPVAPLSGEDADTPFPLDWGVTIPLALLLPNLHPLPSLVVACPSRRLSRALLIAWGEALADASDELGRRVALIVSADQGHGHAADGPYGFSPVSARYDRDMRAAIEADALPRLLHWPKDYAETALADSYWQTLALIGVQKHVPLRARVLSYEVDHYFGLLCASFHE